MSKENEASAPLYHQFLDQWLNLNADLRDHIHQDVQKGYEVIAPFTYGSTQTYGLHKPEAHPSENAAVFYGGDDFADFRGMIEAAKAYANEIGTNSFVMVRQSADHAVKQRIEADVSDWMRNHVPPLAEALNKSESEMTDVYRPYAIRGLEQMVEHYQGKDKPAYEWAKALLNVSMNYTHPALMEGTAATKFAKIFTNEINHSIHSENVNFAGSPNENVSQENLEAQKSSGMRQE